MLKEAMEKELPVRKERLEEEFEVEGEEEAFSDYACVANTIAANYSLIADELAQLGDFKTGIALDIGSGLGDLAIETGKRYPQLKVIGIDISQRAIEGAGSKANKEGLINVEFRMADVHRLDFPDNSVELVISHGVMHHLRDLKQVIAEIYRVLKPKGLIYLSDLRRDAPDAVVKEVAKNLPPAQAKAFINSINASYLPRELQALLKELNIPDFEVCGQKFSRQTIIKNKDKLRSSHMRGADYTLLSQTVIIRKQ